MKPAPPAIDWDVIAPPPFVPTPAQLRAAQEQFESESDSDYLRRLHHEQN